MKNLWPGKFEENKELSAKTILEEQAKLLPTLTDGVVFAEVSPMNRMDKLSRPITDDFIFRFDLCGNFLENYRFNVLVFSHDITLYPVKFLIDERIAKEIGLPEDSFGDTERVKIVNSSEELESFLHTILNSERIKNVVGSIVRLSH